MQKTWDALAEDDALFHTGVHTDEEAWLESGRKRVAEFLAASRYTPTGQDTLVDIGCGVGRNSFAFARHFGEVIGVDVSQVMVEKADGLKDRLGVENARFVHGNGVDLSFLDDASVDYAFSYVTLIHVPGPQVIKSYIREMERVVRPGGTLFFQLPTFPPGIAHLPRILRHFTIRRASRLLAKVIDPAKLGMNSPAYHGSRMTLPALMRALDPDRVDTPFIRVGPLKAEYTGPTEWDRAYHTWVLTTRK
jgi:ubiquinone/menaquinone biosynthesis C-methylase UbiE